MDSSYSLVRNMGAGPDSPCCLHHPQAAPARVVGTSIELSLEGTGDGWSRAGERSRNGARVAFARRCEPSEAYIPTDYQAINLIGKTLSWTVDLSRVEYGHTQRGARTAD